MPDTHVPHPEDRRLVSFDAADGPPMGTAAWRATTGKAVHPLIEQLEQMRTERDVATAKVRHLETALERSRQIGIAIGIVMTRRGLTPEQAFDALCLASQKTNRKIRDLADDVAFTGELPT